MKKNVKLRLIPCAGIAAVCCGLAIRNATPDLREADKALVPDPRPALVVDEMITRKSDICQNMVQKTIDYIAQNGIAATCSALSKESSWRQEEIYPWIFDVTGNCYIHGVDQDIIWEQFGQAEGSNMSLMQQFDKVGKAGGFCNFSWNNSYCRAYVKVVNVGTKRYIVGASFYPASPVYIIDELVSAALAYLGRSNVRDLCEKINNPTGSLVRGDIHLSIYDMAGTCLADGEQVAFVGQNLLDATTGDNKFLVRDVIAIAKTKGQGWYDFVGQNGYMPARMFVKKIVDPHDKREYVITSGYYTTITDQTVTTVVKEAVNYLKAHGREIAFRDFSSQPERFARGNVHVFVYDLSGKMMADSANPAFVGLNLINSRDMQGRYITRQVIDAGNQYGKGWVTNNLRNSYQVAYVEKVKAPDGDFIVGAAYFPVSKEMLVSFMVRDAELFILNNPLEVALRRFTTPDIDFLRGDISMSVFTQNGICLAQGLDKSALWSSIAQNKDEKGKKTFEDMLAYAKSGGGWITVARNQGLYRMFIKGVTVPGTEGADQFLLLTSGYYQ